MTDENRIYTYYANAYAKVKSGGVLSDDVGFGRENTFPERALAVALAAVDVKVSREPVSKSSLMMRIKRLLTGPAEEL